jgi:hypothetical protein
MEKKKRISKIIPGSGSIFPGAGGMNESITLRLTTISKGKALAAVAINTGRNELRVINFILESIYACTGVTPTTRSNFAASSPAFAPGSGAKSTVTEFRTSPSFRLFQMPSFSLPGWPFT